MSSIAKVMPVLKQIPVSYWIAGAAGVYLYFKFKKVKDSETLNLLKEGLKNPIQALGAAAGAVIGKEPVFKGGTKLTENFEYYIKLNGGIDKYLAEQRSGTFRGKPYNQNIDYKKLYFQSKQAKPVYSL